MGKKTDIKPASVKLFFLPVETRVPLKFGTETLTSVICGRACMTITDDNGNKAEGWGETPLSVQWAWPSATAYQDRAEAMQSFCCCLAKAWSQFEFSGHPIEVGHEFIKSVLPELLETMNKERGPQSEPMPWLAALICCSLFDIALHDAYGNLHEIDIYDTYNSIFMTADLSNYLEPIKGKQISFEGKYPADFLKYPADISLPAWHLVGGKDLLDRTELTGDEPDDGYPVLLEDWIKRDGLKCLKIKLRGNDTKWDYERLVKVGQIALENNVEWLTSDFNCTVKDPVYVNDVLDRLAKEHPQIHKMILYVEQPFPYDLENNRIDVHSLSARKPLFMDESAHDWKLIKLGLELGWTGVALKTCKTQTGALLSLCWAKAHGMKLMVQDLTNPMLAQIPHVRLAAHAETIMGVETNAMQFYPKASEPEEKVHPGIYQRLQGNVDLKTIKGSGFGYRLNEIKRILPDPEGIYDK
ncbi:MAG: enolase C-terminal domain-like protein [Planctomycetota bacterium]|jgi:L-alanine-DL-glutamate epimerase-like enolase superfamily enzyme